MKPRNLSIWKPLSLLVLGGAFVSGSHAAEGPPVITTQPASITVLQGSPATFSVVVDGTAPFIYQWRRDGGEIQGATGSSYTIPLTIPEDNNAVYSVFVMNAQGNTTSSGATLRIDPGTLITSTVNLIPIDTQSWRYYTNGGELGPSFKDNNFADGAWPQGPALLGLEVVGVYPVPLRTPFAAYTQSITTYWFRTHFTFSPTGNVAGVSLTLSANVDDGGVFYLNGAEILRLRVPSGQTAATFATADNEGVTDTLVFTPTNLVSGDNVLAAEVHQQSPASSDVVFGMNLAANITNRVADATPPVVTIISPLPGITVLSLDEIEIIFSEEVQGVDASDLRINNQPASAVFHEGPVQYRFTFSQPPTGAVQVAWAAGHGITDLASVPNAFAGGSWNYTLDPNASPHDVRINEFVALNLNGIRDADGDHSDWLELYNASSTTADLGGWFLTDDFFDLTRWRIPNGTFLGPDSYLLIWASGKPGRTNPAAPMHTNFRLEAAGEYLALLDPSTNVVSAFAPLFPEQRPDVSYGRDRLDPGSVGYYSVPTPGAANGTSGGTDFAPDIAVSRQSGTFVTPFSLSLSTASTNAVIRVEVITNLAFTVGNSVRTNHATTNSPIYAAPIAIPHTTQIRARAFEPGKLPGTPVTANFIRLSTNVLGWSSDLPVCIVHVLSAGQVSGAGDQAGIFMTFDNDFGRSSLTNVPSLHTRVGINQRGASTGGQAKSNFAIETWDEFNQDADKSVLGMPPESDWVLYGINGFDTSLMHNPIFQWFGRQLAGQFTTRNRYVEVFRKVDAGPVTTNDYFGLYLLLEKPKRNKNRVDITPLQPEDTNAPAITGGYLLRIDRTDVDERFWSVPQIGSIRPTPASVILDYPTPGSTLGTTDPRILAQVSYIQTYLLNFLTNLSQPSTTNPITGYAQFIDADQWIDNLIPHIICFDVNAYRLGGYLVKDRNQRFEWGPFWDCDRCLGTGGTTTPQADNRCFSPRFWRLPASDVNTDNGTDFFGVSNVGVSWFVPLFRDPDFWQRFIDRYQALRTKEYSTNAILPMIDGLHSQIREAQVREQQRWGTTANFTWPRSGNQTVQGYTFDFGPATNFGRGSFLKEVEFQRKWLVDRLDFLDTNFLAMPILSSGTAAVNPGAVVSVTPAPKANTLLLYTLDGTDPRLPGGAVSPSARTNVGPLNLTISNNVRLVTRSYNTSHFNQTNVSSEVGKPLINSFWSGPVAATYYTTVPPLRITEIMYHPADPPSGNTNDQDNFEYIEVKNISGSPLDVTGFRIRGGVDFDFPNLVLAASQQVVVVRDEAAFRSRYGMAPVIAGSYTNDNLANDGDNLRLEGRLHEPILDFRYEDGWYPSTDGAGFSLQIVADNLPTASWGLKSSWRPSGAPLGTPGQPDTQVPVIPIIYINEALTHTIAPTVDAIELYNPNGTSVNVTGWFLTDDRDTPKKYRLPNPTIVPANGYLVLSADTSFGNAFQLSSHGDELFLFSGDANTNLTGYTHGFDFGPQSMDATFGRYVTSTGEDHFPTQRAPTLGSTNAGPKVGPIVISEINYHPPDLSTVEGLRDNLKDEYIELENITQSDQPLYDPDNPAATWRLRDAVTFAFPTGLVVPPGGHVLVVGFDPELDPEAAVAFQARNGAFQGAPLLGPYSGQLDNSSASVELVRPAELHSPGVVDEILVDKVRYANTEPWPMEADGLGLSLQRRVAAAYGNDPANWTADIKSPGYIYGGGNGPVITVQPQSISVLGTRMAQFSVEAAGTPPLFYQWYLGGSAIFGATNSILIIPSVQPGHAGQYRCLVQSAGGATLSNPATLTYIAPPNITLHPTNVIVRVPPDVLALASNRNTSFRVAATSTHPPLSYQWLKNGTNIPLALNPSAQSTLLTISNVVLSDDGVYQCAVTDGTGTIFSLPATLTAWISPTFLVPPIPNQTNPVSTAFSVSVVATGHPPPYTLFGRSNSLPVGRVDSSNHAIFFTFPADAASRIEASTWYRLVLSNVATPGLGVAAVITNHTRADFDRDGLPDYFEVQYGLNTNNVADAAGDLDGDKMTNLAEFIAGTDPSNPDSFLKIEQNTVPGTATLFFGAAAGKTYTIQYADHLTGSPSDWNRLADFVAQTSPRVETVVDPNWSTNRFYRVATPRVP